MWSVRKSRIRKRARCGLLGLFKQLHGMCAGKYHPGLGVKSCNRDTTNFPPYFQVTNYFGQVILGFDVNNSLNLDISMLSSFIGIAPGPHSNHRVHIGTCNDHVAPLLCTMHWQCLSSHSYRMFVLFCKTFWQSRFTRPPSGIELQSHRWKCQYHSAKRPASGRLPYRL